MKNNNPFAFLYTLMLPVFALAAAGVMASSFQEFPHKTSTKTSKVPSELSGEPDQ